MGSRVRQAMVGAVLLCVTVAACGGDPASEPDDDSLVSVGTEAWVDGVDPNATALPSPADGPATESADPEGAEDEDPTAQNAPGAVVGSAPADAPQDSGADPVNPTGGVDAVVDAMSVEQKVGQLFVVTVIGDDATQPSPDATSSNLALYGLATPAEVVERYHLGGVAYFDHDQGAGTSNVSDLTRTAGLSAGLQQAAADDTGIGLLIGTDQEGGSVVRLRDPATVFPSARDIARTGEVDLARQAGAVTGAEARAVGVNWVYAPDADVNVNPANPVIGDRAFGTTAAETVPFVGATADGLAAAGVLPTLKHFPGHGDTSVDSHNALPTIDHDRATLDAVDFPPFAAAISMPVVSVMVGHLAVPALDPSGRPATISPEIVAVLRQDLGFDGLVVTDAMDMGALSNFGDSGTLAVDAINAGIDMVLLPTDLPLAWNAVLTAVGDGTIPEARLDAAVGNVLRAKESIGVIEAAQIPPGDPTTLGSPDHQAVRDQIGQLCGC